MSKRKAKPKTIPTYVRMRSDLRKLMEDLADQEKRDFSKQIEIAVEEHLQKRGLLPSSERKREEDE